MNLSTLKVFNWYLNSWILFSVSFLIDSLALICSSFIFIFSEILLIREKTIKKNLENIETVLNKGEICEIQDLKEIIDLANNKKYSKRRKN